MTATGLYALRDLLREGGGLMADLLAPEAEVDAEALATDPDSPALIAARGPRAEGRRKEYELFVETIYEGYLLHYAEPRVLRVPEADLRVLAGDRLYALGLARLVALGDTLAVAELADTITLSALAQGAGEEPLARAVWDAGAKAVGWGPSGSHRLAKDTLLAGGTGALEAMRTSAMAAPASP